MQESFDFEISCLGSFSAERLQDLLRGAEAMFWTAIESLLMIGALSAAIIWYAVAHGRREDRDGGQSLGGLMAEGRVRDPDAHLGRRGTE
jgi:hypothetical protein